MSDEQNLPLVGNQEGFAGSGAFERSENGPDPATPAEGGGDPAATPADVGKCGSGRGLGGGLATAVGAGGGSRVGRVA